jgi:hypothetical protein
LSTGTAFVLAEWLRNEPRCTCGWTGKRRVLRAQAVLDALFHCADTGHTPAGTPLDGKEAVPVIGRDRLSDYVGLD